jgi:hypothetical protein
MDIRSDNGGVIRIEATDSKGRRRIIVYGDEGGYAAVTLTPEVLENLVKELAPAQVEEAR